MSLPEQSADTAIIRVENLEHSYGDFKAVDDISFSVKKGEIFSFLGPNGAGRVPLSMCSSPCLPSRKEKQVLTGMM